MQSLSAPPPRPPGADAVHRALETAGTSSEDPAGALCAFVVIAPGAERVMAPLRPPGATVGTWVLVTVPETLEDQRRAHLQESALTAAQRFMLALACDGIDGKWVREAPEDAALAAAGVALGAHQVVGAVWCTQ